MKQVGRLMGVLVACSVAALTASLAGTAQAQTQEGQAVVQSIKGSADYSEGGGTWSKLKVGKVLKAGTVVRTADASEVDLNLKRNGPVVRLTGNSTLGLTKLLFENTGADTVIETQLDLKAGRVLGVVSKMAAASKYEVKTPSSVTGIRGTKYDISASGKVVVIEGWVMVVWVGADGKSKSFKVEAGKVFDPATQTVRDATETEKNDAKNNMPRDIPPGTEEVRYEPGKKPFVSPISPADSSAD